jgi:hypothetical protein
MQLSNIVYSGVATSLGAGAANNGLSVNGGIVQLGGPLGAASAAQLLNNREIPLNGFGISMTGLGLAVGAHLIFQYAATAINSTEPQITMLNHLGVQIGALRIGESNDSVYLGNNAGSGNTGIINVFVGGGAGAGQLTATRCIFIGGGAGQGNVDGMNNCIAIGNDAMDRSGSAVGLANIIIGQNAVTGNFTLGNTNIIIGSSACQNPNTANIGNFNLVIGNGVNLGAVSNTAIIGVVNTGASLLGLSNVFVIGDNTKNILLGQTIGAWADSGDRLQVTGNINLNVAGNGIKIATGANGTAGTATLVAGTIAVAIANVTANSLPTVTLKTPAGGALTVKWQAVCTAGTLTITALLAAGTINAADTSVVTYIVVIN